MQPSSNTVDPATIKVLVVDDNHPSALTLTWALESQGYDVVTCFDGPSAISAANHFQPDVILLDIGMPVMNGLEVCRQIRANPALRATSVYAQTGWGDNVMRRQTLEAGFDRHMTKPLNLDNLLSSIETDGHKLQ